MKFANGRLPQAIFSTACGALYGASVARILFETFPLSFGQSGWRIPLAAGLLAGLAAAALLHLIARPINFTLPAAAFIPLLLPALSVLNTASAPLRDSALTLGGLGGFAALVWRFNTPGASRSERVLRAAFPGTLAAAAATLYLATIAPTVGQADTFEFQVNAIRLGISHGSGYPLYLILAKLFSLLPLGGTAAFRVNLSAAAFGVTASLAAYALSRQLGASRPAAWVAGLSLAASIGLWSRAVEAEVYTLHVTLVGALLLIALGIQESGVRRQKTEVCALAFVFGLSLTNHLTTMLLAPALLIAWLTRRPAASEKQAADEEGTAERRPLTALRRAASRLLLAAFFFVLGLSLYLYLPIRWPAVNHGETMTWEQFTRFITGQEAQGALRLDAPYTDFSRYSIVGRKALDQFGWSGAVAAAIGFVALARRKPAAALVTAAAYAAYAYFGLAFYVPDPDYSSFLLPAHFVQAGWIALGITASVGLASRIAGRYSASIHAVLLSAFFLLPASLIGSNYNSVLKPDGWQKYRLGQYILSQPLKEGAAILADSELVAPLYYLQVAEGIRPDLDIVVLPDEEAYRAELDAKIASGQTVYLGRYLPHLAEAYNLHSLGPLTEVGPSPRSLPPSLISVEQDFGGVIRLRGFTIDSLAAPADEPMPLTLVWQAIQPPPGSYRVALRLVDKNGAVALSAPASVPVGQMYPTAAWPLDDIIFDWHSLALDRALEPGEYSLQVGLFPPFVQSGLPLASGDSWLTLASVNVLPPRSQPAIPHRLPARFANGVWLMGYDAPPSAIPGAPVTVKLFWLLPLEMKTPVKATVCAVHADCDRLAAVNLNPSTRGAGRIFETLAEFNAPAHPGALALQVGIDGQQVVCGWLSPAQSRCALPPIAVRGAPLPAEAINFDNQIVLDSLNIQTPSASPGQTVIVTAQWRGLRPMASDYTVFIHLLGPDGLVHGQIDTWPVAGTLPTSLWPINQPLADRFEIRVPGDAPPGEYTVEAGWYLLATLDRLPVLDSNGVAIDDKYRLTGLTIK